MRSYGIFFSNVPLLQRYFFVFILFLREVSLIENNASEANAINGVVCSTKNWGTNH